MKEEGGIMKLKSDFITYSANREALLVSTGKAEFSGLVKGNRTLGAILDLLKEETDEASVIAAMQARFNAPAVVIAEDVRHAISELSRIGALDE